MDSASASAPSAGSDAGPRRGRRPASEELIERRRTEIIEAAYAVFSTRGYQAAGIADIAERLGIGHGTFYRCFKNKRDILDHVVDYGVERIVGALELATPQPARSLDEFRAQVREIGGQLFALLDAEPSIGSVVLLEATSIDAEMTSSRPPSRIRPASPACCSSARSPKARPARSRSRSARARRCLPSAAPPVPGRSSNRSRPAWTSRRLPPSRRGACSRNSTTGSRPPISAPRESCSPGIRSRPSPR